MLCFYTHLRMHTCTHTIHAGGSLCLSVRMSVYVPELDIIDLYGEVCLAGLPSCYFGIQQIIKANIWRAHTKSINARRVFHRR